MTDVKPFTRHDAPMPVDRSVAVLLVASAVAQPFDRQEPGLLDSLGATSLFERALRCLEGVEEAVERAVWAEDTELLEHFERAEHPGIRLLAAPPERCLRGGAPDALHATHALIIDGRHPFLRSNTVDEAIRLLRLREDIEAVVACVRVRGELYEMDGTPIGERRSDGREMLVTSGAFSLVPAEHLALGRALRQPASAFEIGHSEAFRVDTPFTRDLADALLRTKD